MPETTTTPNAEQIWSQGLDILKGTMSRATFEQLLAPSVGIAFNAPTLTVGIRDPYTREWLEKRLYQKIVDAVRTAHGSEIEIEFIAMPKNGKPDAQHIEVVADYHERKNALIKPHHAILVTDYFRKQWVPLLGPSIGWLILALRRRAYRNYKTGETRDGFKTTYEDLAHEIGMSYPTIQRAMQKKCTECEKEHDIIEHFVPERKPIIKEVARLGGQRVRVGTFFRVYMDDPLTPADEKRLWHPTNQNDRQMTP